MKALQMIIHNLKIQQRKFGEISIFLEQIYKHLSMNRAWQVIISSAALFYDLPMQLKHFDDDSA